MSSIDAAKAAFYPDINLMAFLQQDALHLSDLFRHSAQQYGITGGLTLPIFDSGRLNANLDIAKAQSNLSIANYNKAVVDAVNDVARAASQVETLAQKISISSRLSMTRNVWSVWRKRALMPALLRVPA